MPAPTKPTTRLAEAIRGYRKEAGYARQSDLASALGVNQSTVSSWESGASRPDHLAMVQLHDAIAVPLELFWADVAPVKAAQVTQREVASDGCAVYAPALASADDLDWALVA